MIVVWVAFHHNMWYTLYIVIIEAEVAEYISVMEDYMVDYYDRSHEA